MSNVIEVYLLIPSYYYKIYIIGFHFETTCTCSAFVRTLLTIISPNDLLWPEIFSNDHFQKLNDFLKTGNFLSRKSVQVFLFIQDPCMFIFKTKIMHLLVPFYGHQRKTHCFFNPFSFHYLIFVSFLSYFSLSCLYLPTSTSLSLSEVFI